MPRTLKLYQVDAFSKNIFGGNPAAVCPLDQWLPDDVLQLIAAENNLSETAFFTEEEESFKLRWFTPRREVDLCGHATLATAHVIFNHLSYHGKKIRFHTRSGKLTVKRDKDMLAMDFPAYVPEEIPLTTEVEEALGLRPLGLFRANYLIALFGSQEEIQQLSPDFAKVETLHNVGVVVTAPGKSSDFVSRFFAPAVGINEDPVTGSAHAALTPLWTARLQKDNLFALQLSKRLGAIWCRMKNEDRVVLEGHAVTYLEGKLFI